jgi:hypothetical protein
MNYFKLIWLYKNNKKMCNIKKGSKVMKNSQLMDYMVSLHFIDFISWGVLDNGPLYCITLWLRLMLLGVSRLMLASKDTPRLSIMGVTTWTMNGTN